MRSSKPPKVRLKLFTLPLHLRSASLRSRLSDDLKSKYGSKALRIRKGDVVKVIRGEYKGVEGKVTKVFTKTGRVSIEGVTREKVGGTTTPVRIHASKVTIVSLNLDDKWRKSKLESGLQEATKEG